LYNISKSFHIKVYQIKAKEGSSTDMDVSFST
jgi:hypothetical protein